MGVFNNFCASRNAPLNWLPRIFVYGHQERVRVALEGVIAKRPGDPLRGGGNRALAPPDQGTPPTAVTNFPNRWANQRDPVWRGKLYRGHPARRLPSAVGGSKLGSW